MCPHGSWVPMLQTNPPRGCREHNRAPATSEPHQCGPCSQAGPGQGSPSLGCHDQPALNPSWLYSAQSLGSSRIQATQGLD